MVDAGLALGEGVAANFEAKNSYSVTVTVTDSEEARLVKISRSRS